jgi:hypothetical protein
MTTEMRNGITFPSAQTDFGRASHGFGHRTDASASNDAIAYDAAPERAVGELPGRLDLHVSQTEGSAHVSQNPSTDIERIAEHNSVAQAEMDVQDTNARWSNAAAKPTTYATSAVLDVTKLEPSAPLSTADALEALAGLANSLPAVPTNVSHNFSSSGWSHHSYEQAPPGREYSHQSQAHQYYEEQHRYVYQHTGPYTYSTESAASPGYNLGAAPSIFGQGSTGQPYRATDEHSSAGTSAPSTQAAAADADGTSFSQAFADYHPAASKK